MAKVNPNFASPNLSQHKQFIPEDIPVPKKVRVRYKPKPPKVFAEPVKPGQAPAVTNNWVTATYRTGDGDTPTARRSGSDHSHLKSHGYRT